ncbi:hypothetical protein [Photobacterium damselae]|uniref:hypothetical protein n=1 Tax=Photobacterium damselae TaxID=38293 RepID=UPI0025432A26
MSDYKPLVKRLPESEVVLPSPQPEVNEIAAEERRTALKHGVNVVEGKEEGGRSVQISIDLTALRGVMGFSSDAETNDFITDQDDNDIVADTLMAGAVVKGAFEIAEKARHENDTSKLSNAQDVIECVTAVSDAQDVSDTRLTIAQENQDQWSKVRKEVLHNDPSNTCKISGNNIEGPPQVDHKKLKSEYPEHCLNKANLRKVNADDHTKRHVKRTKKGKQFMSDNEVKDPKSMVGCSTEG